MMAKWNNEKTEIENKIVSRNEFHLKLICLAVGTIRKGRWIRGRDVSEERTAK